jgi:putative membrane protein insertion efficiency factor
MPSDRPFAVALALASLRAYKVFVSHYFVGSCRFLPSCADYASEAILQRGLIRGSWLAACRLARCHPFCEGGHDPVPVDPRRHRTT